MGAKLNDMRADAPIIVDDNAAISWQVVAFNRDVVVCVARSTHQSLLVGIPIGNSEVTGESAVLLDTGELLDVDGKPGCAHLAVNLNNRAIFDAIG